MVRSSSPRNGGPSGGRATCGIAGGKDAIRAVSDAGDLYTFWDYQGGAFAKNDGIRIDNLLLSPQAADKLVDASIDRHVRGWDKPSDHVPVFVDLDIAGR
jgi:exodeoxyribonuclease-3